MEPRGLKERFLLCWWAHGDHRVSEKRGEYHSYTGVGWMGRVIVVGKVALGGRRAVHRTGLRGKFYE